MLKPAFLEPASLPLATSTPYEPSSWMIATRMSFGSLPNFALAFFSIMSAAMRPNCCPLACGRNTYFRFLFSTTAVEMQVVIHMKFLSCSTRAATGTHCAEEKNPRTRLTFSCSIRRTASLMATSGLLCASA